MDPGSSKRRDKRFDVQLALSLRVGNRTSTVLSENVSYRGVFLRTDTPPPLRQLVKLEAVLPPTGAHFATHGMSVFVIQPGDPAGRAPGAGIQFYGMGDEKRAWETFVNHIKPKAEGSAQVPVVTGEPLPGPEEVRRRFERIAVVLEVRPRSVDDLLLMWSRDVSAGGMFLTAAERPPIGSELRLAVKHPTSGATFALDAVVRRHETQPAGGGVGVEFVDLSDGRRRQFFQFVTSTVTTISPAELGVAEIE